MKYALTPTKIVIQLCVCLLLMFAHGNLSAQTIRCADPNCAICLSAKDWKSPEKSDSRAPRNRPEDAPFGREASLAVVNPVLRSPFQRIASLRGEWDFQTDPDGNGVKENWNSNDTAWNECRKMPVPGNWESNDVGEPGMSTPWICYWDQIPRSLRNVYIGSAWYRTTLCIPNSWEGRRQWLKIGGVRAQGWFWVNGQPVARVAAYCGAFRYDITDLIKFRHNIGEGHFRHIHSG